MYKIGIIEKIHDKGIDLLKNKLDYVSTARYTEYNTQVWFRDSGDYDAFLTGNL